MMNSSYFITTSVQEQELPPSNYQQAHYFAIKVIQFKE